MIPHTSLALVREMVSCLPGMDPSLVDVDALAYRVFYHGPVVNPSNLMRRVQGVDREALADRLSVSLAGLTTVSFFPQLVVLFPGSQGVLDALGDRAARMTVSELTRYLSGERGVDGVHGPAESDFSPPESSTAGVGGSYEWELKRFTPGELNLEVCEAAAVISGIDMVEVSRDFLTFQLMLAAFDAYTSASAAVDANADRGAVREQARKHRKRYSYLSTSYLVGDFSDEVAARDAGPQAVGYTEVCELWWALARVRMRLAGVPWKQVKEAGRSIFSRVNAKELALTGEAPFSFQDRMTELDGFLVKRLAQSGPRKADGPITLV